MKEYKTVRQPVSVPGPVQKTRPIHEVRFGAIKAAVWKNETPNGVRFGVTLTRLYRDGDQWKTSDSFGRDELLLVAKVADEAHSWICLQGQDANQEGTSAPGSM